MLVNHRRPSTRQVLWHAEGATAGDDGAADEHPRDDGAVAVKKKAQGLLSFLVALG